MDMRLSIVSDEGGVTRVRAGGKITQNALTATQDALGDLLGEGGYGRRVALSLADATFIDSSGLGWLLQRNKLFREAGGCLVIHSVPPVILEVIQVMRLDQALKIVDDEAAAASLFSGEGQTPTG